MLQSGDFQSTNRWVTEYLAPKMISCSQTLILELHQYWTATCIGFTGSLSLYLSIKQWLFFALSSPSDQPVFQPISSFAHSGVPLGQWQGLLLGSCGGPKGENNSSHMCDRGAAWGMCKCEQVTEQGQPVWWQCNQKEWIQQIVIQQWLCWGLG